MSCKILTERRLARLRDGTLPADERAVVARHLAADCDDCDERLGGLEVAAFFELLGGAEASASGTERERLFGAAGARRSRSLRRLWWCAPGLVAALAAALTVFIVPRTAGPEGTGIKGALDAPAKWAAWVGESTAAGPRLVRPYQNATPLSEGELLVLRVTTPRPAYVQVLAQFGDADPVDVWAGEVGGRVVAAGEGALSVDGMAQALDPSGLEPGGTFALISSPEPVDLLGRLETLEAEHIRIVCPDCGVDLLRLAP